MSKPVFKRFAAVTGLVLIALSLGGCSKCGWFWESGPRACRSDKVN